MTLAVLLRQLKTVVRRGVLRLTASDYFCQVEGSEGERQDDVELWQSYGLASRPPVGSEVLWAKPGLTADSAVVFASQHRGSRPELEAGEVALYAEHGGQVLCDEDGDVELTAKTGRTVNVGGSTDAMVKGTTLKVALDAFSDALAALTGAPGSPNEANINAIKAAGSALKIALELVLSSKAKVA